MTVSDSARTITSSPAAFVLLLAGLLLAGIGMPAAGQGFLQNFLRPSYLVPLVTLDGTVNGGDLNATYQQILAPRRDDLEVLIIGEYPRARYFSIILYDDHGAIIKVLEDKDIVPLFAGQQNPFSPGGPSGAEDILYAVTIRLGDGLVSTPFEGCGFGSNDVHVNLMDARHRHTAFDFYSCQHSGYTVDVPGFGPTTHDDGSSNGAITAVVRQYLPQGPGPGSAFDMTNPLVWLRSTANGCPLQLAPPGTSLPASSWFKVWQAVDFVQMLGHGFQEKALGFQAPYGVDPLNGVAWFGVQEYLLKSLPERYLTGAVPFDSSRYPNAPAQLNAEGRVLKLSLRLPQMPCAGFPDCPLAGSEQLRYWSLSFARPDGSTQRTVSDAELTRDANGYVTMIVSFGVPLPAHVTAENGYSVVMLPEFDLARLDIRNIQPAASFACSSSNVPPRVGEHHSNGGYMGEYAPFATFPTPASLPATAVPFPQPNTCAPPVPHVPACP